MTKKRLFLVSGAAVLAVALATTGGVLYATSRTTPEERLYNALTPEPTTLVYDEEATSNDGNKLTAKAMIKKDGTIHSTGDATCKVSTEFGDTTIDLTFSQVQNELFLKFNNVVSANSGDEEFDQAFNDFFKEKLVGKHVLIDSEEAGALSLKRYGVMFSAEGVYSTKIDRQKIVEKLKEHKVYTIHNTSKASYKGDPTTEYSVTIRRAAYEKFIDSVVPSYDFKDQVLDTIFSGDTEEIDLNIANKTGAIVESSYSEDNLCAMLLTQFDETAAAELPTRMKIKSTVKTTGDVKVEKPVEFMTAEEYAQLFVTEE